MRHRTPSPVARAPVAHALRPLAVPHVPHVPRNAAAPLGPLAADTKPSPRFSSSLQSPPYKFHSSNVASMAEKRHKDRH